MVCLVAVLLAPHLARTIGAEEGEILTLLQAKRRKDLVHPDPEAESSQTAVAQWINQNGGYVSPYILEARTPHGGFKVRGAVASQKMEQDDVLFTVPKKLWIKQENFPEFQNFAIPDTNDCRQSVHGGWVRLALSLGVEMNKGDASFWAPWLKHLPTFQDYSSYHPIMANAGTANDFEALRLVQSSLGMRRAMNSTLSCIQQVQRKGGASLPKEAADVPKELLTTALMHLYARSYSTGEEVAMVPGPDLLNTDQNKEVNTEYDSNLGNATAFHLKLRRSVEQGQELYDSYCWHCDNVGYMLNWGVFLGRGAHQLSPEHKQDPSTCSEKLRTISSSHLVTTEVTEAASTFLVGQEVFALWKKTKQWYNAKIVELRSDGTYLISWDDGDTQDTVKQAQELDDMASVAPRCRADVISEEQGPLRCSLARHAFEECKHVWKF